MPLRIPFALALLVAFTAAFAEPEPCAPYDGFGFSTIAIPRPDGGIDLEWRLLAAPIYPLPLQPALFLDAVAVDAGKPVELDCQEAFTLHVDAARLAAVRHAIHVTVLPHPTIPRSLLAQDPAAALAAYARALPPGIEPWADVELHAPAGALPWPLDRRPRDPTAPVVWPTRFPDGSLVPDGVSFGDFASRRIARARVGETIPFDVTFDPSAATAGSVAITCLLDGRQIPAFDGSSVALRMLHHGEALFLPGRLRVERQGWQRLQCLMLSDEAAIGPYVWPRPLLAAYVWGDP